MDDRIVFSDKDFGETFKVYSIIKRERRPKSLLARPQNFSWPPKSPCRTLCDSGREKGDHK